MRKRASQPVSKTCPKNGGVFVNVDSQSIRNPLKNRAAISSNMRMVATFHMSGFCSSVPGFSRGGRGIVAVPARHVPQGVPHAVDALLAQHF